MIVRKMKLGDHTDIKKYLFESMSLEEAKDSVTGCVEHMNNNGNWTYLVAEADGKVIGTTYLEIKENSVLKHTGELYTIVVAEEYRRRGIARKMIETAAKLGKEKGLELLVLSVRKGTPADLVYPKLGFIKYGELPNGIKEDNNNYFDKNYYYLKL